MRNDVLVLVIESLVLVVVGVIESAVEALAVVLENSFVFVAFTGRMAVTEVDIVETSLVVIGDKLSVVVTCTERLVFAVTVDSGVLTATVVMEGSVVIDPLVVVLCRSPDSVDTESLLIVEDVVCIDKESLFVAFSGVIV